VQVLGKKIELFTKKVWITLLLLCLTGFFLRILYFPYEIPIILDGLSYFLFAYDVSTRGVLPTEYYVENDGWPIFLGFFFKFFYSENFLDYITYQRIITIILSTITTIPIFFLCRRFVEQKYALIGAAIFVFEPRLIQNSLTGITEPLYLLLISSSLALFFNSNKKLIFMSFGFIALATLVRGEGLFLFVGLSIVYFIRFRHEKKMLAKYMLAILIFVLVLLPSVSYRFDNYGHDGILNKITRAPDEISISTNNVSSDWITFGVEGIVNMIKFLGWDLIPIFIFFVPIGVILTFKRKKFQGLSVILIITIMLGPAWFSYLNNSDTRFLFVLYPLFCILSVLTIERLLQKRVKTNMLLGLILVGIIFASVSFLEIKKVDYELERDAFEIAGIISQNAGGINSSTEISKYIKTAEINIEWPNVPKIHRDGSIPSETKRISDEHYNTIEEFIFHSKTEGLTHLVIDENMENIMLKDIFHNSEKYSYLEIEYDSKEQQKKFSVKVFKINFDKLDALHINQ